MGRSADWEKRAASQSGSLIFASGKFAIGVRDIRDILTLSGSLATFGVGGLVGTFGT